MCILSLWGPPPLLEYVDRYSYNTYSVVRTSKTRLGLTMKLFLLIIFSVILSSFAGLKSVQVKLTVKYKGKVYKNLQMKLIEGKRGGKIFGFKVNDKNIVLNITDIAKGDREKLYEASDELQENLAKIRENEEALQRMEIEEEKKKIELARLQKEQAEKKAIEEKYKKSLMTENLTQKVPAIWKLGKKDIYFFIDGGGEIFIKGAIATGSLGKDIKSLQSLFFKFQKWALLSKKNKLDAKKVVGETDSFILLFISEDGGQKIKGHFSVRDHKKEYRTEGLIVKEDDIYKLMNDFKKYEEKLNQLRKKIDASDLLK